jgi:glycosyltransferase involved in cell wall biosynthesis
MGLASRVVTVSHAGEQAMLARGFGKKRVRVVLNGAVGSPRLAERFEPAVVPDPAILTICGLHHRNGVADLINAFKFVAFRFPSAQLYLVGEGPSQADYQTLVKSLELFDRVHFLGYRDDPREYLHAADIFVLAAHSDPGPLVIREAKSADCAIAASNEDGIPEMLDHGEAGILVPPRRPDLLARAIERLLVDPAEIQKFSQLARANTNRFTTDRICREMDSIDQELVR